MTDTIFQGVRGLGKKAGHGTVIEQFRVLPYDTNTCMHVQSHTGACEYSIRLHDLWFVVKTVHCDQIVDPGSVSFCVLLACQPFSCVICPRGFQQEIRQDRARQRKSQKIDIRASVSTLCDNNL